MRPGDLILTVWGWGIPVVAILWISAMVYVRADELEGGTPVGRKVFDSFDDYVSMAIVGLIMSVFWPLATILLTAYLLVKLSWIRLVEMTRKKIRSRKMRETIVED